MSTRRERRNRRHTQDAIWADIADRTNWGCAYGVHSTVPSNDYPGSDVCLNCKGVWARPEWPGWLARILGRPE